MIRLKKEVLEKKLEERKPHITLSTYLHIQKVVNQGADSIDAQALSRLCHDLECLPVDIVEYV